MTTETDRSLRSRIFSRRRLVLLTSVAGIGAIVALGGPMAYGRIQLPAWTFECARCRKANSSLRALPISSPR